MRFKRVHIPRQFIKFVCTLFYIFLREKCKKSAHKKSKLLYETTTHFLKVLFKFYIILELYHKHLIKTIVLHNLTRFFK